jgi:hypothetical protein
MKFKIPVKIVTLTLFISLLATFVLYQSGYLFPEAKTVTYVRNPNGGTALPVPNKEGFGLTTFQKLKLSGAFDPEHFNARYNETIHFRSDNQNMTLLSSSKSARVIGPEQFDHLPGAFKSMFEILLEEQWSLRKPLKK